MLSCSACSDGLLQSSVIIGIVVWLLLLTIFFIVVLVVLLATSTTLHKADAGRGDPAAMAAATVPPPARTSVARPTVSSHSRSFYANEPWINALPENVLKEYALETIVDA